MSGFDRVSGAFRALRAGALGLGLAVSAVGLAGCAATGAGLGGGAGGEPVFAPAAAEASGLGYDHVRLGPDVYRVWFSAPAGTDPALVERLALRHAAELALAAGADHVQVLARIAPRHAATQRPVDPEGAPVAGFGSVDEAAPRTLPEAARARLAALAALAGRGPQRQVTALLDVRFGTGPRPAGAIDAAVYAGSFP